ncbi:MAG: hypothetical protein DRP68_04760 [Candidatus Omnitrophota bacterium]|nr:MAG: hypothetical protein DRP68_04760 [Candidatus Omnitrophota bacterium]RKY44617.1 MAG: hypothetical protein DRP81_05290 [Candidatus Omnitrophota bacterium]
MFDYIKIFSEFNRRRIKYIVVGGLAVNLYGIPRMTYDIDLLLDMEEKNLKKFLLLLKRWGFKPKIAVDIMDFTKEEKRRMWVKKKNMKAFNLFNPSWPLSEIDILINTPVDYKKAKNDIKYIKIKNIRIPLISIRNLIKMKESSKRKQDKTDCFYLKKIMRDEKESRGI